jgi:c-di-GMP-binding flagellar brake protein YcgR
MRLARYSFDCELTLTVYRSGQKQELWGRAADISEGGVAATLSETLEVGEIALIRVEVEKKTLNLRAAVRYRRGHFCGFEFLAMSLDQREAIKSLCGRLHPIAVVRHKREP